MDTRETIDFSTIPEGAIEEILRNGEACLEGTIQLAIAADQRATTMAGIFGAGSVALLAVAATILAALQWSSERYAPPDICRVRPQSELWTTECCAPRSAAGGPIYAARLSPSS